MPFGFGYPILGAARFPHGPITEYSCFNRERGGGHRCGMGTAVDQALWLLVIAVAAGDGATPTVQAMAQVAEQSLGLEVRVEERRLDGQPAVVEPGVVRAEVHWESDGLTAALRLSSASGFDGERRVSFREEDPAAERGRTLAFLVAAMLPESLASAGAARESPATATAGRAEPTAVPDRAAVETGPGLVQPAAGRWSSAQADSAAEDESTVAVEALAALAMGLADAGASGGLGGALAVHLLLHEVLALRLGCGARAGDLDAARATTLWLAGDVGASWTALRWGVPQPVLTLELGISAGAARQSITHYSPDDLAPDQQAVWTATSGLRLELAWHFRRHFALVLRAGADVLLTGMDVLVGARENIGLSRIRDAFGLGIRADL